MIVSLFSLAAGKRRAKLAAYSNQGLGKYFRDNLSPSGF